jgi:hypothetical membrane protein
LKSSPATGDPQKKEGLDAPSLLFIATIIGIILYVVLDAVAQSLPPHYSPIRQAESDLAVGPYGYIMTINFVNRGLLSLAFLYGLNHLMNSEERRRYRAGVLLLGIWGVGALLLAAFPTDVPSTPISWHGAIHLVVAIIAFFGGAFGTLAISLRLGQDQMMKDAKGFALPLSVVAVIVFFGDLLISARIGGLIERIFIGSVLLWLLTTSIFLWRKARAAPVETTLTPSVAPAPAA